MNKFTNYSVDYEKNPGYIAFKTFFDTYMLERDCEKTLSLLDDEFYSLGTGGDEIAANKADFTQLLKAELDVLSEPLEYKVKSICGKEIVPNVWDILAEMEIMLPGEPDKIAYSTRFTGCFGIIGDEVTVFSTHMSEPSRITEEREFLPLKYMGENILMDTGKTEQIIFEIMSKSMPGGIISGYAKEGFPLYFVNDQYLNLLGYSSYEEYYEAANGLGITHIHPDDMTEDAKLREVLIREFSYDFLTGIHNRGGGIRSVEKALKNADSYTFAYFDIDNLKRLNDEYNHSVGDHALKYFADLLKQYLGEETILARMGGDEFVAFINKKIDKQQMEFVFSNLEEKYCDFIQENYPKSKSSVSIGCLTGMGQCTFDELCKKTDELMYDIKKHGKHGYKMIELS